MIVVYKIMHGVESMDRENFLALAHNTRIYAYPIMLMGSITNKRSALQLTCGNHS